MFQLMIADDNPYILKELCNITDWENFDLHIVGTYLNGKALLQAAQKEMPDVVLTDVSMPVMDGISLASELRQLSSDVKIIFISSYAEFEYAQKAMMMKISGYILKPFKPQQLAEVMNQALEELRQESFRRFEQNRSLRQAEAFREIALENYMCELLHHAKRDCLVQSQLEELELTLFPTYQMRIAFAAFSAEVRQNTAYSETVNTIRSTLQNYPRTEYRLIFLPIDNEHFAVLVIYFNSGLDIASLLAQLNIDIETMTELPTVMGFSMASGQFSDLPELFRQAQAAAMQSTATNATIISYEEIRTEEPDQSCYLDTISQPLQDTDLFCNIPDVATSYVEKMRDFIQTHYMEQITTSDVAASVFLSPNYANQLFSAEYNCTIFDYITQCRIYEAKRLLTESNAKITSIAELTGYSSRINFYLAFKRNVGISPTEYKNEKRQEMLKKKKELKR